MPTRRACMASLAVAFVVVSVLADGGATPRVVTGTVTKFEAGEWMSVANQRTDSIGFPIALRATTVYEGNPAVIKPGARVTVRYRSVGERHPVADEVRVLRDAAAR